MIRGSGALSPSLSLEAKTLSWLSSLPRRLPVNPPQSRSLLENVRPLLSFLFRQRRSLFLRLGRGVYHLEVFLVAKVPVLLSPALVLPLLQPVRGPEHLADALVETVANDHARVHLHVPGLRPSILDARLWLRSADHDLADGAELLVGDPVQPVGQEPGGGISRWGWGRSPGPS
jgi:hypothetical protein